MQDSEVLFRHIFSPHHLDESGKVNSAAFSDVAKHGLSCDRGANASDYSACLNRGIALVDAHNNTPAVSRGYVGLVSVQAGEVRALLTEQSTKAFAIYDTALSDNADHVDVFQNLRVGPAEQKRMRKQLRDCFIRSHLITP